MHVQVVSPGVSHNNAVALQGPHRSKPPPPSPFLHTGTSAAEERPTHNTAAATTPQIQDRPTEVPPTQEPAIWSRNFRYYFTARSAGLLSWAMLPVAVSAGLLSGGYGLDTAGYAMAFLVGPFAVLVLFGGVLADRFTARRM